MPEVHQDIRDWLRGQPDWLQQAAEILLASGSVADEDIQTLADRLKTTEGQEATAPRSFDVLGPVAGSANALRLLEVGDISGIEKLNPRTPLTFGDDGNLSVIYGHNGSGKSGYTRLLKRACGKPRAAELKPNVFEAPPKSQKCCIGYQVDGEKRQSEWEATAAPIDELLAVDIFDTDTALFYLREETSVAYTPPSVALFEALATVCDRVKARLDAEKSALVRALPALPGEYVDTDAGKAYQGIKAEIDDAGVEELTCWSAEDEQSLAVLNQRLGTVDPSALARSKRGSKVQGDELATLLRAAANAFGEAALAEIRTMREAVQAKRRIAAESGQVSSANLEGFGSDTWRAMWEAARKYSQVAYPGKAFPVTDDDSRCLLCQQGLDDESQLRLRDFEAFVQSELEKEASAAETTYREALSALPDVLTPDQITTRCQAAGLMEEEWAQRLGDFWRKVGLARQALLEGEANGLAVPVSLPGEIVGALNRRSESLEREATQHEKDAAGFDRLQAAKDKRELEVRRWISQQAEAIRSEVVRLRQRAEYDRWLQLANSRPVSLKAGEIAEQVVTQAFVDRFNRELRALGASQVKVELSKTRTDHGKVLHKLRLKGAHTDRDNPDLVLSEGERRIVSLAAFLADVVAKPHAAPFIFDDPISSLDQDYEWRVATRLVELAKNRQVVVFTHRLSLYGAMEDAAKKLGEQWKKENLQQICIESFGGNVGHPADKAAWGASTKKANNILLSRLADAKKAGEERGAEAYKVQAQVICTDFRKLLERTVEDDLLNQIVRRHRRGIQTDNRLDMLHHITSEDCKFIDDLMTKYSCYEHSQSSEAPVFLPEEPELREDLESLKTWRERFKKRPGDVVS